MNPFSPSKIPSFLICHCVHRKVVAVARRIQPAAVTVHAPRRTFAPPRHLRRLPDWLRDLSDRLLPALVQRRTAEHRHLMRHALLFQHVLHLLQTAHHVFLLAAQVPVPLWPYWSCLRVSRLCTCADLHAVLPRIGYDLHDPDCHDRSDLCTLGVLLLVRQVQTGNPYCHPSPRLLPLNTPYH